MKAALALVTVLAFSPLLPAERRHVVSDDNVDFAALKTFWVGGGRATTTRPELSNALILRKTAEAIRAHLSARGLTEFQDRPDVMVSFTIGQDRPNGPSVIFDQGTLVIEMTARASDRTVWQGVYTDDTSPPAKVAERLSGQIQKLLAEYPPKKKTKT